jgi:ribonuclease BN (tRNA processing enzyme)
VLEQADTVTKSALRVFVAGSSSSIPRPRRACSCYVVRSPQASVLFDLGTGALSNVREALDYSRLDAVVISHMHADHFLDVIPLRYALKYGPFPRTAPMPLYLPTGGQTMLRQMCAAFSPEWPSDFLDEVFDVHDFDERSIVEIGDLRLTFAATVHYVETYAIRASVNGSALVYSSDTASCESVVGLARDADAFLCECTLDLGIEGGLVRGHSSSAEAGAMAHVAGVGKLLLTHYGYEHSPEMLEATARECFAGPCSAVDDESEFSV